MSNTLRSSFKALVINPLAETLEGHGFKAIRRQYQRVDHHGHVTHIDLQIEGTSLPHVEFFVNIGASSRRWADFVHSHSGVEDRANISSFAQQWRTRLPAPRDDYGLPEIWRFRDASDRLCGEQLCTAVIDSALPMVDQHMQWNDMVEARIIERSSVEVISELIENWPSNFPQTTDMMRYLKQERPFANWLLSNY